MNDTIQKHSTNNTKHSKYKYTYYQNTHIIVQTPQLIEVTYDNRQCLFKYHETLLRVDWHIDSDVSIDCGLFFNFNGKLSKQECGL